MAVMRILIGSTWRVVVVPRCKYPFQKGDNVVSTSLLLEERATSQGGVRRAR